MLFRNKNVLLFGLGLLGGGVAAASWLMKHGARITITDLKTKQELEPSIKQLKGSYKLLLGGHDEVNVADYDAIVLNPGVSVKEPLIQRAIKLGNKVVNEATIFYENFPGKIIGITGTRGKTTTATWTAHLIGKNVVLAGNSPDHPFLKAISYKLKAKSWSVTEMSSFSLELFEKQRKPDVAVITNIYQDHFNRYKNYHDYVKTKANLFIGQSGDQHLILNFDNSWTPFLLTLSRKSTVWFFSLKKLAPVLPGLYLDGDVAYFQEGLHTRHALEVGEFAKQWGSHNVENLFAAALAAHAAGVAWEDIQAQLASLPQIPFRQEIVYYDKELTIINDTAATSPEGTIAAVMRFGSPSTILITGGTDRKLNFTKWGKIIPNYIVSDHMVFLEGSATVKMLKALGLKKARVFKTLKECVAYAVAMGEGTILFSPASKSFEKFKNEFDRGEQFNLFVKKLLPSHKTPHISL